LRRNSLEHIRVSCRRWLWPLFQRTCSWWTHLCLPTQTKAKRSSFRSNRCIEVRTRLLVQIDPSALTDFGTTQTTLNVTLAVGSKGIETDLHFDYTGTPAKASTPKPTPPKATPPKAKAPNTSDRHASKVSPASFDFSKESGPKPLTITGDQLQMVDTFVLATSPRKIWRRGSDSNRRVMVLQTIPLGHLGTAPYSLCPKSMSEVMPNAPDCCLFTPVSASLTL
jgi:hypothetical protein